MSEKYIRKEVLAIPAYHVPIEPDAIKLNQNESPWELPPQIKIKITERLLNAPWNRYAPADLALLKAKLAAFLKVDADSLVLSNGSNVLVQALLLAIAVGKKVMTVKPTFSIYKLESQILGNRVIEVPLNADFTFNRVRFLAALKKEKPNLIFIANPNAPTGNLFSKETLLEVVQAASCPVVIDEAYYPFSKETLIDDVSRYPNLIVMRTFSKAFAMAGVRLGYLVLSPALAKEVSKVLLPFCVPTLTQVAAEVVLDDVSWVHESVLRIIALRDALIADMQAIPHIEIFPSQANFILFRVKDAKTVFRALLASRVLIRDVSDGDMLADCLRVSVGTVEENRAFVAALRAAIA